MITDWAVIDCNLLLLLIVGRARRHYVEQHKRLRHHYTAADYERVEAVVALFAGVVVVPQVLAEVHNLSRHIGEPARGAVLDAFSELVQHAEERWVSSRVVVQRPVFRQLGLTDAILLSVCADDDVGRRYTLITADQPLAYCAQKDGLVVISYFDI